MEKERGIIITNKYDVKSIKRIVRRSAMDWFNRLSLEEQFYKTIEHNSIIAGDNTRHPSTLTGREIETIYLADA